MALSRYARLFVLAAAAVAWPGAAGAIDAICKNCGRPFECPDHPADRRATGTDGAGKPRLRGPCCDCDCEVDPRHIRAAYQAARDRLRRLETLRRERGLSPREQAEAESLSFRMDHLRQLWAAMMAECGLTGNIDNDEPPRPAPRDGRSSERDRERQRKDAESAATAYDRLARQEREALDMITGFFGSGGVGGGTVPAGFNGERAEITRGYQQIAGEFRRAAELLKVEPGQPPAKLDPKDAGDFKQVVKPVLRHIELKKSDPPVRLLAGAAVEARLRANAYVSAYIQSLLRYLAARSANDDVAAARQAQAMTDFAYLAHGYGATAARKQYDLDEHVIKALEAALQGGGAAARLEKFQAEMKDSGLPAELADALKQAKASDEEVKASRDRLLALKPADVETFVAQYKARGNFHWFHPRDGQLVEALQRSARALTPKTK